VQEAAVRIEPFSEETKTMMRGGRFREDAARSVERRRREDEAPRLLEQVPRLKTLRLEVEERRGDTRLDETKHTRIVMVERASSVFFIPCGDTSCKEGEHELTYGMLRELRADSAEFVLEDDCRGSIGSASCTRTVRVLAKATYAKS
jgi:hypothetical protein